MGLRDRAVCALAYPSDRLAVTSHQLKGELTDFPGHLAARHLNPIDEASEQVRLHTIAGRVAERTAPTIGKSAAPAFGQ